MSVFETRIEEAMKQTKEAFTTAEVVKTLPEDVSSAVIAHLDSARNLLNDAHIQLTEAVAEFKKDAASAAEGQDAGDQNGGSEGEGEPTA